MHAVESVVIDDPVFGVVSLPQLQMYRSRGVTVDDHLELREEFGVDAELICKAVAERSVRTGRYEWWR